jgi:hypothetical protein
VEKTETGLKTMFKEMATATLRRSLGIRSGEIFRLSMTNLGHSSCDIGPQRQKTRGSSHAHVNLLDIPPDANSPELSLQLGAGGWVNVENKGKSPLTLKLRNTDRDRFRYVYTENFEPKTAREGVAILKPGEMVCTKQEGDLFLAEWEIQDKKVVLGIRGITMGEESGLSVSYKLEARKP